MSVKKVVKYGTLSLRQPSKEVHKVSQKIKNLVADLLDTMYADTGIGMSEEYSAHILSLFLRKIQAQEPNLAEADLEWLL